jgi:hypothetical protein
VSDYAVGFGTACTSNGHRAINPQFPDVPASAQQQVAAYIQGLQVLWSFHRMTWRVAAGRGGGCADVVLVGTVNKGVSISVELEALWFPVTLLWLLAGIVT